MPCSRVPLQPILQKRKLSFKEIKKLPLATQLGSKDSTSDLSDSKI